MKLNFIQKLNLISSAIKFFIPLSSQIDIMIIVRDFSSTRNLLNMLYLGYNNIGVYVIILIVNPM